MREACRTPLLLLIAWAFCTLVAVPTFSAGNDIPPERIVDLILKILTYDKNLPDQIADTITVGIITSSDNTSTSEALHKAFTRRKGKTVAGFGFDVVLTVWSTPEDLETMLKELSGKKPEVLVKERRQKFLDMGSKGLAA